MTPVSLAAFLYEYRVPFPVAVDAHAAGGPLPVTMGRYGLRGTPSLVLIDRQGRLRANLFGRPSDLAIGAAIATLVAESGIRTETTTAAEVTATAGCDDDGCTLADPTTQRPSQRATRSSRRYLGTSDVWGTSRSDTGCGFRVVRMFTNSTITLKPIAK